MESKISHRAALRGRGRSAEVFMPELREALARFDDGKEDEFDPDRAINDLE